MAAMEALLQAVLDDPEQDGPRLAYADHCDERGDPRGEFIRAQCELTAMYRHRKLDDRRFAAALATEDRLLKAHARDWARPVEGLVEHRFFHRGFVEHIALDARRFLQSAPRLYQAAPIRHLTLTQPAPVPVPGIEELARSPLLDRIVSLSLAKGRIGDAGVRALAASAHLGKLRWLDLSDNDISRQGLEELCASPGLPELRYLEFKRNRVADPTSKPGGMDADTGQIFGFDIAPLGRELMERYGRKAWLTYETDDRFFWPPRRDAV